MLKFIKSPLKYKKYRVYLEDGSQLPSKTEHKQSVYVDFGDNRYQQYKDRTPLKLYSNLDHLDKVRRDRYYARHNKNYPKYSADWFSKKYLW